MDYKIEDVKRLYGDRFYLMEPVPEIVPEKQQQEAIDTGSEVKESSAATSSAPEKSPGIEWKLKPGSKVIFMLHQNEWSNRELTDLLKKIVQSLEISTDLAGFGLLPSDTALGAEKFAEMPAQFGVVFDSKLNPQNDNPGKFDGKQIFFAHTLEELTGNNDYKRALWDFLKTVKAQLKPE